MATTFPQDGRILHAYRIDHILGFFRIWEIPYHSVHGLLGQFFPSLPMSKEEIQSFGLDFDKERMTRPYIDDQLIDKLFGDKAHEVRHTFLKHLPANCMPCDRIQHSKRKVETYFDGKDDPASTDMREKLYSLISDVLFIADRDDLINSIHASPYRTNRYSATFLLKNSKHSTAFMIITTTSVIMNSGTTKR